jgi:hypothetical protein
MDGWMDGWMADDCIDYDEYGAYIYPVYNLWNAVCGCEEHTLSRSCLVPQSSPVFFRFLP